MTYDFVHLAFNISLFIWFPLTIGIMIFLLVKGYKKWSPKLNQIKVPSVNGIAMWAFIKSIPTLLIFCVLQIPLFYFSHQTKQYNYCMDVVRINKMTDINNKMLQERCSQFDLEELMQRAQEKELNGSSSK